MRGRSLIAAGVACLGSAFVLGEADLLRVAVLLIALPMGALPVTAIRRLALQSARDLAPRRAQAGATVSVTVRLSNTSRRATPPLVLRDTLPEGANDETVEDGAAGRRLRLRGGETREFDYRFRPARRGRFSVGPLAVQVTDPFGLCELRRTLTTTSPLVVAPEVVPLGAGSPGWGRASGRPVVGESAIGTASGSSGDDDQTIRPYRVGDDLRRVHWRTTARLGELSVRQEDRTVRAATTLLLDVRREAFGPEDFEDAVVYAASIATALAGTGANLRFEPLDGRPTAPPWDPHDQARGATPPAVTLALLLDMLADLQPRAGVSLPAAVVGSGPLAGRASERLVAVLGRLERGDVASLCRLTPSWLRPSAVLVGSQPAALEQLRLAGWRAVGVRSRADLVAGWQQLSATPAGGPLR